MQKKKNGKLQLIGLTIGKYKNKEDWSVAFSEIKTALKSGLKKFEKIILSSDGDLSIINTAKNISTRVKIQKDKWHVFHQLKYYLWKDGVKKELRNKITGHFFKISMLTKRTVKRRNQRINIGVWSDAGALNVCKIRGAYYYNGISPLNWKKRA